MSTGALVWSPPRGDPVFLADLVRITDAGGWG
jgi:hypothetical protein